MLSQALRDGGKSTLPSLHTHTCTRPPTHTGSHMITTIKTTARLLMCASRGSDGSMTLLCVFLPCTYLRIVAYLISQMVV